MAATPSRERATREAELLRMLQQVLVLPLAEIHVVITDREAPAELVKGLRARAQGFSKVVGAACSRDRLTVTLRGIAGTTRSHAIPGESCQRTLEPPCASVLAWRIHINVC